MRCWTMPIGNMVWKCPIQIFDAHICGRSCHIQWELESIGNFFPSCGVGNLTTIMATIDVWWQYDSCTLLWVTCPCQFLERCSSLYIHPFEATIAMSNVHNTHDFGDFCWLSSKHGRHLTSLAKGTKMWRMTTNMCFFKCSWSTYNVFVLHQYLVFNYKHVLRHNKIAYSSNTHGTFFIAHSHILKDAPPFVLHTMQLKSTIPFVVPKISSHTTTTNMASICLFMSTFE